MSPGPDGQPADAQRVLREGRLLARVTHPNVVTVYAADEFDGHVGLWMQFIDGVTLEEELGARGALGAGEATLIGLDLCRALAALHSVGLVHRDVKPQNVMRESGGRIILMDLGAGHDTQDPAARTARGMAGTPLYLAPELFGGAATANAASDIYSLGVLLYHLVTARYPVEGASVASIERAHTERRRTGLRDVRSDLPPGFVQVIERAIEPDPEARYRTAGELERALVSLLPLPAPSPASLRTFDWGRTLHKTSLVAALLVTATWVGVTMRARSAPGALSLAGTSGPSSTATTAPTASGADAAYNVDAAFYLVDGEKSPLRNGSRVKPGDRLYLTVRASRPAYVYVVNEDDAGEAYLLFPLPGQELNNPLPAERATRLPGTQGGRDLNWQVTSAGGEEHFLVFVSPNRLASIERMLDALPRPELGRPVQQARLPSSAIDQLRGVGGLAPTMPSASNQPGRLHEIAETLKSEGERARGLWVRQLTLDNPTSDGH